MIKPGDVPTADTSYLYGCFKQTKPSKNLRSQSGIIALAIADDKNENEYKIRFGWDEDVICVPVKPGCYHVSKWYSYDCFGSEKLMEQDISDHVRNNNFCLEAGKAYYLGDYISRFEHEGQFLTHIYVHILNVPEDNYEERTELFDKIYPAFANIPKEKVFKDNFFKDEFNKEHVLVNKTSTMIVPVAVPAK